MANDEPRWLTRSMIDAIHTDQLQQHGGFPGVNNEGLVESALARPRNRWAYADDNEPDRAELAAAYGFGFAKNHGFRDGNKRIAFLAMYVFLGLNDRRIAAEEPAVVELMKDVAAGACSESELANWLRAHMEPR
jgi:death-on-curing protein